MKLVAAIVVVSLVLGGVYWVYVSYFALPPWVFKGAYGKYYGEDSYLFMTVKITLYREILEFNKTHYKVLVSVKLDYPLSIQEEQLIKWVAFNSVSEDIVKEYESTVYIDSLGISRDCTVYEHSDGSIKYYDKKTGFPIKFHVKYNSHFIDLNLVETNVPL